MCGLFSMASAVAGCSLGHSPYQLRRWKARQLAFLMRYNCKRPGNRVGGDLWLERRTAPTLHRFGPASGRNLKGTMRIQSSRLGFSPSYTALELVDSCVGALAAEDPVLSGWHTGYVADHRVRIAHDLDIISQEIPRSNRVLEVGSIPLLLTASLVKLGYGVLGCDIAPERYYSTIRSLGLNVVKCNIETERLPFEDASFDAVIFNELFEHLRINPIFTLSEMLRVLKPNGLLTVSTPNLKSLGGIKNFLIGDRAQSCSANLHTEYTKLRTIGHMGHVREYTPTEVIEFLQTIGFNVTAIIFRGDYAGVTSRFLIRWVPRLSPFISYIARKPR